MNLSIEGKRLITSPMNSPGTRRRTVPESPHTRNTNNNNPSSPLGGLTNVIGSKKLLCLLTVILVGALFFSQHILESEIPLNSVNPTSNDDTNSSNANANANATTQINERTTKADDDDDDSTAADAATTTSNHKNHNKKNASPSSNQTYKPFNSTNPHVNSWCPYATCQNSPLCAPCNRRYILILATGRSGSTTLLKMMNYLPTVRLSGENRNFIGISSQLITNYQLIDPSTNQEIPKHSVKGQQITPLLQKNSDRFEGAFAHNAIPPQTMSCPIQNALNALNPPPQSIQQNDHLRSIHDYDRNTILGCKTIRFHKNKWDIHYAANYIKEVFPCSKIIINIRTNVTNQLHSIQDTFSSAAVNEHGKTENEIDRYNTYLSNLAETLGSEMAKVIDLSHWKTNVTVLNDVVHWLGFKNCKFTNLVHENSNGYGRDHDTDVGIDDKCHYPHL